MATSKKAPAGHKEDSLKDKIGHVIQDVKDTVVETYNKVVHPGDQKTGKKPKGGPRKTASQKAKKTKTATKQASKKK